MDEDLDALFARFRGERDPELLARVFDRTAPRLLRLAIHLAGDPGEAEDLVQATFLTAIERAPSFDGSRALVPWLLGILANHARSAGRKERREPALDRLIAREQETPLEEAQRAEISGRLAKAIDELPEPYRQTLTLRLRHGMKAADIAHVLGKSPGAVRVRIHRGLEMLREKLPAGFAAWLLVPRTRGLGAIRSAIVTEAGGALVGKKLLVAGIAAALLLAGIAGVKSWRGSPDAPTDAGVVKLQAMSNASPSIDEPARNEERSAVEATGAPETTHFRIRVVEGGSDRPIAGARVRVFHPRKTHLLDLVRRWSEFVECSWDGTPVFHDDIWPHLASEPSDLARAGREEIEVVDPPLPGVRAIADEVSDAEGACEVEIPSTSGFVACSAPGFDERFVPLVEGDLTIRVWKPAHLAGYVIDTSGDRVRERIRLRFWGRRDVESGSKFLPSDRAGHWIVETDADGGFDALLAADTVQVSAVDPEWELTKVGRNSNYPGQRYVFRASFRPGRETEPAILVARRCPVLVVTDALSGQPIETFSVSSRDSANGYTKWSGGRFAAGGRLRLTDVAQDELTVWAEHRVPQTFRVEDRLRDGRVVVALERGELPVLQGTVRDGSGPKAGVVASVLGVGRLQWNETDGHLLDAVTTDSEGRFSLAVPEGEWMLRCTIDDVCSCRMVHVPSAGPVLVDLGAEAALTVRVRDAAGSARPAHAVVLHGEKGRQTWKETNERGEVEFRFLPPGEFSVHVPKRPTQGSFSGGERADVTLLAGERKTVDVTVPIYDPRFARIVANPPVAYDGWRASRLLSGEWSAVEPDGRIPIDLQENVVELRIESPDATRWTATIPENAPDGYAIRLELAGRGYEGALRDRVSGRPLSRVRIVARPVDASGPDRVSASVLCGPDGAFRMTGLADRSYELSFQSADDRDPRANGRPEVLFYPASRPDEPAVRLELDLPRRDRESGNGFEGIASHVVSGHVRVAGAARENLFMNVASVLPSDQGSYWLYPESAWCRVNDVGAFTVTIPFAPRHEVHVWDRATGKGFPTIVWDGSSFQPEEEVRDLDLPE